MATTVARPSAATARPITGSRSVPVISATALTFPTFSATRAMTAGSTRSTNPSRTSGRCQPVRAAPSGPIVPVRGGKPNQSALLTPSQSTRKRVVSSPAAGPKEVMRPKVRSKTQDSA